LYNLLNPGQCKLVKEGKYEEMAKLISSLAAGLETWASQAKASKVTFAKGMVWEKVKDPDIAAEQGKLSAGKKNGEGETQVFWQY